MESSVVRGSAQEGIMDRHIAAIGFVEFAAGVDDGDDSPQRFHKRD